MDLTNEMANVKRYKCADCLWIGHEDELDHDLVETCMGSDEIEMCPKCGSLSIFKQPQKQT